ncbi:MFS transporter [Sutterella sp.]|uniref:MFS transporter n=1 Tax=Sutterella sp. TaxID=1981025 RepID=UPI0026DED727|nr:MFS transporter [Sutterella sp.]MDO5530495.1 MFS transporter [Sutterella sp.]
MARSPAVSFVLACVFLDALGIGLIIPVLPRLIGTLAPSADMQATWYGAIMVSYGLMQFFSAPAIGALSDRIGRRPVLLTGILGLAIMMLVPAFSQSLTLILLSRILGGAMSSNIVVAQAYIADVTAIEQRTAAFGRIGAIFGIAFILGPALGGMLGETDPRLPFLVAGIICGLNFLYGFFVLPESLTSPATEPFTLRRSNPFSSLSALSREKLVLPILLIITLCTLSQSLMQCTWALYTEFRYGWTPKTIGFSIFVLGAAITVTQGWILPRLSRALDPQPLVLLGLTAGAAALIGIGLSTTGEALLALVALFSIMGVVGPTLQSIISRTGSPTTQGVRLGAASSLNSFTGAVSPVLGTPLLFFTSKSAPGDLAAGVPYFLGALLVIIAIAVTLARPLPGKNS